VNTPAGTPARLENRDIVAEFREFMTGNKPGHSGAQNEHLSGRTSLNYRRRGIGYPDSTEAGSGDCDCASL
jgi:hypothetical protein